MHVLCTSRVMSKCRLAIVVTTPPNLRANPAAAPNIAKPTPPAKKWMKGQAGGIVHDDPECHAKANSFERACIYSGNILSAKT